jgi:hypothetical protein
MIYQSQDENITDERKMGSNLVVSPKLVCPGVSFPGFASLVQSLLLILFIKSSLGRIKSYESCEPNFIMQYHSLHGYNQIGGMKQGLPGVKLGSKDRMTLMTTLS